MLLLEGGHHPSILYRCALAQSPSVDAARVVPVDFLLMTTSGLVTQNTLFFHVRPCLRLCS